MAQPGDGDIRIGDDDRQAAVDALARAAGAGLLTLDEFADFAGRIYATRTEGELAAVLADLPTGVQTATTAHGEPVDRGDAGRPSDDVGRARGVGDAVGDRYLPPDRAVSAPEPATPVAVARRRRFLGIMSSAVAKGRWRAPERMAAVGFWGSVHIDLRDAVIESAVIDISAWGIMGSVTITVPPGIPVDMDGFVLMGSSGSSVRDQPIPGAPLVRVRARGLWGSVSVRSRRHRNRSSGASVREDHRKLRHEVRDEIRRARRGQGGRRIDVAAAMDDIVAAALDRAHDKALRALSGRPLSGRPQPGRPQPGRSAGPPAPPAPPGPSSPAPTAAGQAPWFPPPPAPPSAQPSRPAPSAQPTERATGDSSAHRRIPEGTLTILVSDIAGSTQMAHDLGDQRWLDVLQDHNRLVREHIDRHGGTEVKAQGDGFLIVFPSARSAVQAAIAIQRSMAVYRDSHPDRQIELRLGLHTGEVATADGDVFGQNVVVASRIADAAAPGDILVSGLTRDLTASASDLRFDAGESRELKGVSEPWRVHRVTWE